MSDPPDRVRRRAEATSVAIAATSRPGYVSQSPSIDEVLQRAHGALASRLATWRSTTFVVDLARTFVGQGVFLGLQIFATFTVARALLPDAVGLYSASLILLGTVTFAGDLQIQASAVRARGDDHVLAWSALVWSAALTFVYTLLVAAATPHVVGVLGLDGYDRGDVARLLDVGVVGLVLKALATPSQVILLRRLDIRTIVAGQVALAVANAGLTIVLALLLRSAMALAWSVVAGLAAELCYFVWATRAELPALRRVARVRRIAVRPFATFGGHALVLALVTFLGTNVDNSLVVKLFGASALGSYAIARNLARWVDDNIATVVTRVLFPTLACDLRRSDGSTLRSLVPPVLHVVTACCCVTSALIILIAPTVVPSFLGPRWQVGGALLQILALDGFFAPITGLIGNALISAGRLRDVIACHVVHVATLLCVLVALGGRAGLAGVALAEVAGAACAALCACWMLRRFVGNGADAALRGAIPWGGVLAGTMLSCQGWRHAQLAGATWLPPISATSAGIAVLALLTAIAIVVQSGSLSGVSGRRLSARRQPADDAEASAS